MNDTRSFRTVKPIIERISFRKPGYMTIQLEDGRMLLAPLNHFPTIAGLTATQRRQYQIIDDTILLFRDDDEVYHVQDFLGTYETNAYQSAGKQSNQPLTAV